MKLKNSFIEDVNPKMNFMDIDEFSRKISTIKLTIKSITDKKYGNEEIYKMIMDKMKENPFQMADDIWGIGFKTADGIAQKLGFAKEDYN